MPPAVKTTALPLIFWLSGFVIGVLGSELWSASDEDGSAMLQTRVTVPDDTTVKNTPLIKEASIPLTQEFEVSDTFGAFQLHALHVLHARWYPGTIMKYLLSDHGYLKVFTVTASVSILLMILLPKPVLLNMLLFVVYVLWSSALLFVNSYLISEAYLQPVVLIALHMFTSACITRGLYCTMPNHFAGLEAMKKRSSDECYELYRAVALVVGCFAASLVLENSAYAYTSVAFLQMLKETGLIAVAAWALAMGLDTFSPRRLSLLALVVAGACMCVRGELRLTFWGPVMQVLSNFCNGARLTIQNKLLVQKTGIQLEPLSYVALLTPICFGLLFPPALAMLVIHHNTIDAIRASIGMITLSCTLAVGNNLLVAVLVQRASAIGFALLGACKNSLIVLVRSWCGDFNLPGIRVFSGICQRHCLRSLDSVGKARADRDH